MPVEELHKSDGAALHVPADSKLIISTGYADLLLTTATTRQTLVNARSARAVNLGAARTNMGNGSVVYTYYTPPTEWTPVSRGSINAALWKFACGKQ